MTALVEGHYYLLDNFEKKGTAQTLQFIQKEPKEQGSTELVTIADGTTNEELCEVLINRMNYLQKKFPCRENALAITNFEQGLIWLEKEQPTA